MSSPSLHKIVPTIDQARMVSAWTYWDAGTDDARLVWEVLRAAHAFGAVIANYVQARTFDRARNVAACGAVGATTTEPSRELTIRARTVVNATGVWASEVGRMLDESSAIAIRPAKGIHLLVPEHRMRLGAAVVVPSGAKDRRSLFAIPWLGRVLLGTTDTEYAGSLDQPAVEAADVDYVLSGINKWMDVDLTPDDLVASYAGLRPLRAGSVSARTADLSRKHAVSISNDGVISITGGKLTTFRRMARDAIDACCERHGERRACITHRLRLGISRPPAAIVADVADVLAAAGSDPSNAARLVESFGDLAPDVAGLAAQRPDLAACIDPDLSNIGAEIAWAARHEMVVRLDDALSRRMRLALLDRSAGLNSVAPRIVAAELGWSDSKLNEESARCGRLIATERGPAAPPLFASRTVG